MQPGKVIIGHSWIDVSLNIQTKAVAFALSQEGKVYFLTQARVHQPPPGNSNLKVVEWPNKRPTRLRDFIFAIRLVKAVRPNLIIVHFAATKALLFAGWLLGVPHRIAWYHTLYQQTKQEAPNKLRAILDVWVRTLTYRLATALVVQTPFAAKDAIQNQRVSPAKVHIIPNGMAPPLTRRPSYDYEGTTLTFLYVGRITHTKGCDLLIPVFTALTKKYNHIALQFVGKGEDEMLLKRLIAENNLQNHVTLPGATPTYAAVYEKMEHAYALLVPSRVDNYPTVIMEAMACGLPVIGANAGGIPYMIEHGVDGYICNNEQQWIANCELLINNPSLRNSMSANARASFENKFAIERHVENVLNFIHSLP